MWEGNSTLGSAIRYDSHPSEFIDFYNLHGKYVPSNMTLVLTTLPTPPLSVREKFLRAIKGRNV
jgi:hypothetical protein